MSAIFANGLNVVCLVSLLVAMIFGLTLSSAVDREGGIAEANPNPVVVIGISIPMIILAWVSFAFMYTSKVSSESIPPHMFWIFLIGLVITTPVLALTAAVAAFTGGGGRATLTGFYAATALSIVWAGTAFINFLILIQAFTK